jgi:hypothetical protein
VLLILLVMVAALGWFLYYQPPVLITKMTADSSVPEKTDAAAGTIEALRQERATLRQRVAALERSSQIDRESVRRTRKLIEEYQSERLKLEEELTFLRGIISQAATKGGLSIHNFELAANGEEGVYRFRFTVSQVLKNFGVARGGISITLDGTKEGQESSLSLADVTKDKKESLSMRFKHFQNYEGVIRLPKDFKPTALTVEVKPTNKKLSPVSRRFKWVVIGKGGLDVRK